METINLDNIDLRTLKIGDILDYKPSEENKEVYNMLQQEEKEKLGIIAYIVHENGMTIYQNFIKESLAVIVDELYLS